MEHEVGNGLVLNGLQQFASRKMPNGLVCPIGGIIDYDDPAVWEWSV
ncbi:hypothetical protein QP794_15260 [Paenibacillus sp. UMB7766-LJ446]|nr:hypothetical protein [Paenibacillus sp. UMB7766-LJ446]MDK8191444.1 hypothetical protein [Paenibacillus sp. UMB7766-LJ446]